VGDVHLSILVERRSDWLQALDTTHFHWLPLDYRWVSTGVHNWTSTGTPLETPLGWGEGEHCNISLKL
jgi:hypothetical protein